MSVIYEYIDYELGLATFVDRGNYLRYGREETPQLEPSRKSSASSKAWKTPSHSIAA